MPKPCPWIAYYEVLPGGQYRMTDENLTALERTRPDRVFFAELVRHTERVVLLDFPFRVAEELVDYHAYTLHRIALAELPGWLHAMSPISGSPHAPFLKRGRLKSAQFKTGGASGQDGVEITFEYQGETYKARHTGCPVVLLRCAEATLRQENAIGRKLIELQSMRLIGAD